MKLALEDLELIERQVDQLDQQIASLLREHQEAVQRLTEVPGLGVDSVQQIIAEIGAKAATFPSAANLVSWVGACPGEDETAGINRSKRSPKGNRQMRRILYEAANAAVKHKGSIFETCGNRSTCSEDSKSTLILLRSVNPSRYQLTKKRRRDRPHPAAAGGADERWFAIGWRAHRAV